MRLRIQDLELPLADFNLSVSLDAEVGVLGIMGESGSGKTSLMEVLAGWRKPAKGFIQLGEMVLEDSKLSLKPEQRRMAYIPQDYALFPHLNVRENLYFGHTPGSGEDLKILELLELERLLQRRISELSGGEKQRVAMARALLSHPQLLLLDEPLANLNQRLKEKVITYLQAVRAEFGVPMIYVSHSRWELDQLTKEVLFMEEGRWVEAT